MSYERYYPNGWQSGQTGGTPMTPEALNHMEQGIADLDSEKAPAGYGLGETSGKIVSTPDEAIYNGFYNVQSDTYTGDGSFTDWRIGYTSLLVERRGKTIHQTAKYKDIIWYRTSSDGGTTWTEWEWVNLPMAAGVEYRTTERWKGKAVYTKLLNCGKGANGLTEIPHDTSITNMLRCAGTLGGVWALPFFAPGGLNDPYTYWCNATRYAIQIYVGTYADVSAYDVHVQMWYTKD